MKRSPAKPVLHARLRKFLHPSCEQLEQIVSPNDLGLFRAVHPLAGLIDAFADPLQDPLSAAAGPFGLVNRASATADGSSAGTLNPATSGSSGSSASGSAGGTASGAAQAVSSFPPSGGSPQPSVDIPLPSL